MTEDTPNTPAVDLPSPNVPPKQAKLSDLPPEQREELIKQIESTVKELADMLEANPSLAMCLMVNGASIGVVKDRTHLEQEILFMLNMSGFLKMKFNMDAKLMLLAHETWPKDPTTPLKSVKLEVHPI